MDGQHIILGVSNIFTGLLIILICIPLVMGKVSMNKLYGVRFKKSYESEENWYKINAYGGRQMITWSIPIVLIGLISFFLSLKGKPVLTTLIACAPLIILIPAFTSYLYARKL